MSRTGGGNVQICVPSPSVWMLRHCNTHPRLLIRLGRDNLWENKEARRLGRFFVAKIGCGALMLLLGAILLLWIVYNLFFENQPEFRMTLGGLLFLCGLGFVGFKWVTEGWAQVQENSRSRPRKKKKRRRPVDDDDDRFDNKRRRRRQDDDDEDPEPRKKRRRPIDDDNEPIPLADDDEEDEDREPRKKRRRRPGEDDD